MSLYEKGIVLTILLMTVNATLLMSLPLVGVVPDSTDLFSWAHSAIISKGETAIEGSIDNTDEVDTSPDISESSITAEGTESDVTDVPLVVSWVPLLGQVWSFINFLLFGFLFTMEALGAPLAIQFILGIVLGAVEIITLFNLVLSGISAIAGVFR